MPWEERPQGCSDIVRWYSANPIIPRDLIPSSNSIFNSFESFHFLENALLPYNRNGVLFPRKIGGKFVMLSRPSDRGHTPFGDIFLSQSYNLVHWGEHRFVMDPSGGWQSTKIGAGPIPIETSQGWRIDYLQARYHY